MTSYVASRGTEYYIEIVDPKTDELFGHLRLRVPETHENALIREVHVFGDQLGLGESFENASQHRGFGKLLLEKAEEITRAEYPDKQGIAVISGVGTWEYYKKFGYEVDNLGYAVK